MKKLLVIGCCLVLVLCGCADFAMRRSKTPKLKIEAVPSAIYTEEEIDAAIETVKRYFSKNFSGCSLTGIRYAGDDTADQCRKSAEEYNADQAILLISSFYVSKKGADDALVRDSTYEGWSWMLTRNNGGEWNVINYGYG